MVKQGTTDDGAWHGHGRDEVTITAVSTVAPAALPVQEHRLPLSNLDIQLPPMDVCAFFCYADSGGRGHNLAAVLKEALAKTLVAYYPLAGEVVANAAGEPEMLCSSRGVDVAEATADGTVLRDLRLGLPDESFEPFVPKKKADAVMAVQVTKFKCGGVVVGSTFDHRVCDAYSINMFLVAWAAAARGSSAPPAPSFDRSFLAPREPLSTAAGNLADRLNIPMSRVSAFPDAAVANRIFRVSGADIAALQASAGSGRTKLQAFTAHLWQLFAKAAAASPRQQPSCCMGVVVDGRGRLRADGSMKAYFGNVLTIPYGVMGTDTLSAMALADVADDVHRWVAEAATEEHFHDLVDWVEAHRPEPSVARAYLGGGEDAEACVVTSGLRLALGEVDFGWGRPAFASFHLPSPGGCGYVMPMPSVCRDGDWVVYVLAPTEVLELMEAEASVFRPLESSYVFG